MRIWRSAEDGPRGLSRAGSRELDRAAIEDYGVPGLLLMEHASIGAAQLALAVLAELLDGDSPGADRTGDAPGKGARVRVLCGPGNNGGDGYAIARHLHNAGAVPEVWEFLDPERLAEGTDAHRNRQLAGRLGIPLRAAHEELPDESGSRRGSDPVLAIDALLGTGLDRPPGPPLDAGIHWLNRSGVPVLAVDIPSGLDADSGEPLDRDGELAVRARWTATFGVPKQGLLVPASRGYTGELFCVPIGVPRQLLPPGAEGFPPAPHRVVAPSGETGPGAPGGAGGTRT